MKSDATAPHTSSCWFLGAARAQGGHTLSRFQGSLCTEEAQFARQVTVLRLEVKITWYFNKKTYTYIFLKGWLAFALLAYGEGPMALLQECWGQPTTASQAEAWQLASALCLLTWQSEPGDWVIAAMEGSQWGPPGTPRLSKGPSFPSQPHFDSLGGSCL